MSNSTEFDIHLYQRTQKEKPNFQFLNRHFREKDSLPSNPNLRINSVLIRRGKLSWHRYDKSPTPGRFNPDHIVLDKISATLSLKSYTADSLNLNVQELFSFEEHSGYQTNNCLSRLRPTGKKHSSTILPSSCPIPG